MGIIQTHQWLKEDFFKPIRICKKLSPYFNNQNEYEIYGHLVRFGMFKPSRATWNRFEHLIENEVWAKVEKLFNHYRQKWSAPDIPVFLFPIDEVTRFLKKRDMSKSGISFQDKMFLFLSRFEDEKEMEALFIHEYHHVCRLNKLNKDLKDYTLLDSIIMEGLAEFAVFKNCGRKYVADWCNLYTEPQLKSFWEKYINAGLTSKKTEKYHDDLLYGNGRYPKLLGYAIGFYIVSKFYQKHSYSTKQSFSIPAQTFIDGITI